jgi:hypothetical protein
MEPHRVGVDATQLSTGWGQVGGLAPAFAGLHFGLAVDAIEIGIDQLVMRADGAGIGGVLGQLELHLGAALKVIGIVTRHRVFHSPLVVRERAAPFGVTPPKIPGERIGSPPPSPGKLGRDGRGSAQPGPGPAELCSTPKGPLATERVHFRARLSARAWWG